MSNLDSDSTLITEYGYTKLKTCPYDDCIGLNEHDAPFCRRCSRVTVKACEYCFREIDLRATACPDCGQLLRSHATTKLWEFSKKSKIEFEQSILYSIFLFILYPIKILFSFVEFIFEGMVKIFKKGALFEFLELISRLAIVGAAATWLSTFEIRRNESIARSWETIAIVGESGGQAVNSALDNLLCKNKSFFEMIGCSPVALTNANFENYFLEGVDLSGADLEFANFMGANLSYASLENANLFGVNLTNANLFNANLADATLVDTVIGGNNLLGANFSGADLKQVDFSNGADIAGAEFVGADLYAGNFNGLNLFGADFSKAMLVKSSFNNASLVGVDFTGANLTSTEFSGADLLGTNFTGSLLTGAIIDRDEFTRAILNGTIMPDGRRLHFDKNNLSEEDLNLSSEVFIDCSDCYTYEEWLASQATSE